MTVLNTPNDGSFNVLIILLRALVVLGATDKDELLAYCAAGLNEPPDRPRHTLNRWIELGLFQNHESKISVTNEFAIPKSPDEAVRALPGIVRRLVFRPANNDRFWESEGSKSADLTRGLAWLLAQDIYKTHVGDTAGIQGLESHQLTNHSHRIVQNGTRLDGLKAWGLALGFLWNPDHPIIDPTSAIGSDLSLFFGSSNELNAADLHARISSVLPVLDGGVYRLQVEDALDPASWMRSSRPELLSTALSRALWRLNDQNLLTLEHRSDSGSIRVLQRANGQEWLTFSHARIVRSA